MTSWFVQALDDCVTTDLAVVASAQSRMHCTLHPAKDTSLPEESARVRVKVEYDGANRTQEGRRRSWAHSYLMRRRKSAKTMRRSALCQMVIHGWALEQQSMLLRSVQRAGWCCAKYRVAGHRYV